MRQALISPRRRGGHRGNAEKDNLPGLEICLERRCKPTERGGSRGRGKDLPKVRRSTRRFCGLAVLLSGAAWAQTGFPFQNESLRYSINWPSGLSLGDSSLSATHTEAGWSFDVKVNAGIPGFAIADRLQSMVTNDLCSVEMSRDLNQAGKKTHEKTEFDQAKRAAHRTTLFPEGGGKSDFDIPACARDVVAFLYFTRWELGQGRVPPPQQVFYGAAYSVRMEYTGAQNIKAGDKVAVTDRLVTYVKGPKSDFNFEVLYARDAARTPLVIRVPLRMGTFSAELVR